MICSDFNDRALVRRACVLGLFLSAMAASPAFATCSAANQFNFNFGTAPANNLNYVSSYSYNATSAALGTQSFTINWPVVNGTTSTVVGGFQLPAIVNAINDGAPATANNLMIGMVLSGRTASITSGTRVVVTRISFPTPIRTFSVQLNDVDFITNQYRDWIHISGINGASNYTPSISTPVGSNNGAGPKTATGSTIALGAATTPFAQTDREAIGSATAPNTDNTGTLTAVFAQPVTSVEIRYGNNSTAPGGTATTQQAFGIQRVSWCPMPSLTVVKSSTPVVSLVTDPNRFNIPGADTYYTLTVTNSNSSPVDLNATVLTDVLPAGMTFSNADIDGTGPLTGNFQFIPGTSGLTLAAGNITYSNNAGSTYAYTPAAGYDPLMTALRINPQGSMAANSTFSVRFRTRIK
jgi:uncharacterized repeat protein (TIGR01451 family)